MVIPGIVLPGTCTNSSTIDVQHSALSARGAQSLASLLTTLECGWEDHRSSMSFDFKPSAPAPAPAAGSFSFGAAAGAAAPAPAAAGFGFGAAGAGHEAVWTLTQQQGRYWVTAPKL